jgi:hypothetical protein
MVYTRSPVVPYRSTPEFRHVPPGAALAHAGTCRYYSDGPDAVKACEDGSVIVRHQDGRVDRYGTPNAGFERYPGQEGRPVFERR